MSSFTIYIRSDCKYNKVSKSLAQEFGVVIYIFMTARLLLNKIDARAEPALLVFKETIHESSLHVLC